MEGGIIEGDVESSKETVINDEVVPPIVVDPETNISQYHFHVICLFHNCVHFSLYLEMVEMIKYLYSIPSLVSFLKSLHSQLESKSKFR